MILNWKSLPWLYKVKSTFHSLNAWIAAPHWIIGGASIISNFIARCTRCRRLRGPLQEQKMADLPEDRVQPAPPFSYCAADYFGPWYVKEGRHQVKRYGVLFTCLASRAVHLEVANSLTVDSFINAYRCFVGRQGPVRQIHSDQGTNFVGARNELYQSLSEQENDKVRQELLKRNCDWVVYKMNVPHARHMGGIWERQIQTVRNILTAQLSHRGSQLDDESLCTFFAEAEAIVNCRPLTVDHLNITDGPVPLAPCQLLTMKSSVVLRHLVSSNEQTFIQERGGVVCSTLLMNFGTSGRPTTLSYCRRDKNGSRQEETWQ